MYIKWMHIENYRNLADVTLSFHNDINYFVGENSVGKSNFLDVLEIIMDCHGFIESDFTDVNKPIRIDFEISLGELNYKSMYTADEGPTYRLRLEQVVQEVYPRLYRVTDAEIEPMPLSMIRHALYVCHRDTSEQELFSIPSAVYVELGHLLQAYVSRLEMPTDDFQREIVSLRKDLYLCKLYHRFFSRQSFSFTNFFIDNFYVSTRRAASVFLIFCLSHLIIMRIDSALF